MTGSAGPSDGGATARLLWAACRRALDAGEVARTVDDGADVGAAVASARRNRITPLLVRALEHAGRLDPAGPAGPERETAELHRFEALVLLPHVLELAVGPLAGAGLEPVVLKGPAVAARYPEPGLRPMEDIDVLLPARDHGRALGLLEAGGWRIARAAGRDRYDTVLTHPEASTVALELHYGLEAFFERATGLDGRWLWKRRVPAERLGVPAYALPLEEEIVYLCAHAAKPFHGFSRLVWIADLAMITGHAAERGSPVDWARVADIARRTRCRTPVATALAMARRLGVDAPPALFPLPRRPWRRAVLQPVLDESWPVTRTDIPAFRLRLALTDEWWLRLGLLFGGAHHIPVRQRVRWASHIPGDAARRWRQLRRDGHVVAGRS